MNRTTRTLLVLLLLGGGSIVALGWIAGRYGALLDGREATTSGTAAGGEREQAEAAVAAFIRVRQELRRVVDPEGTGPPREVDQARLPALLQRRAHALSASGLGHADYLRVRGVYRDWRRRNVAAGEPLALPLERNRERLAAVDLGAYETLDL